ncbi:MAG: hypothetical protein ACTSRK_14115 [Promethearchaeota archaeon]
MKGKIIFYYPRKYKWNVLLFYLRKMLSIKVSKKTKDRIEKTQAKILLEKSIKINQAELLERIVTTATTDSQFLDKLFPTEPAPIKSKKKQVPVAIISRKKPQIRLYPEEWDD